MPTDITSFAATEVTMKYREPYTTEGLNKKSYGVVPPGVYRGFHLEVDAGLGDRTVNVAADEVAEDHLAVVNTTTGHALTVRKSADFVIDLSSYSNTTVVITVYGTYALGSTTAVSIRAYTLAEFVALSAASRRGLVPIGQVAVPVAGVVSASDITATYRSMAWQNIANEARDWYQLAINGSFDLQPETTVTKAAGGAYSTSDYVMDTNFPFWKLSIETTALHAYTLAVTDDDSYDGGQCFRMRATANFSPFTVEGFALQLNTKPTWTAGRRVKVSFAYKTPVGFPVGGLLQVLGIWQDDEGAAPAIEQTVIGELDLSVSSDWKTFEAMVETPATSKILLALYIANGDIFPAPVLTSLEVNVVAQPKDLFLLDAVGIWVEPTPTQSYDAIDPSFALVRAQEALLFRTQPVNTADVQVAAKFVEANDQHGSMGLLKFYRNDRSTTSDIQAGIRASGQIQAGAMESGGGGTGTTHQLKAPFRGVSDNTTYMPLIEGAPSATGAAYGGMYIKCGAAGVGNSLVFAVNCYWDENAALWRNSSNGSPSRPMKIEMGTIGLAANTATGIRIYTNDIGDASWADNVWDDLNVQLTGALSTATLPTFLTSSVGGAFWIGQALSDLGSDDSEALPRILTWNDATSTTGARSLIEQNLDLSQSTTPIRRYVSLDGSSHHWEETWNASWDFTGGLWQGNNNSRASYKVTHTGSSIGGHFAFAFTDAALADWADNAWKTRALLGVYSSGGMDIGQLTLGSDDAGSNGRLILQGDSDYQGPYINIANSNPAPGAAISKNTMYSANILKAFGSISTSGGGAVTVNGGFGIEASASITTAHVVVTLSDTYTATADMAPVVCQGVNTGTNGVAARVKALTTSSVTIEWLDDAGNVQNPTTKALDAFLIVAGKQVY